jgi:uncharacterized membrane protein YhaH (DUF805 family)
MSESCPSCGGAIIDTFCGTCGERRPSTRGYSLAHFAHEVFETITDLDRSFLHTVTTLIRRPGELTAAYMRGERVRYLRPLQLFFLVNVVYFVWAGWFGVHVFNTRLRDRRRPAVQQLVFSIHFYSFLLSLSIVGAFAVLLEMVVWSAAFGSPGSGRVEDRAFGLTIAIGIAVYLFAAFRRAYGDSKGAAFLKAILSVVALVWTLLAFRYVLLYVTAYAI